MNDAQYGLSGENTSASCEPAERRLLRPAYRSYVLALVTVGQIFSFLDRQIVVILLPSIKREFQLSDVQLGLISGFAFVLFYATLGMPLARLADRWSRRNLMALSIALWSAAAMASVFVQNVTQLLAARLGVGIGEAGYSPAAFSLISDYFGQERRQMAAAVVNVGPQIGITLGLMIGGTLAPLVGWRGALLAAGAPGLLFALLFLFTVREPRRGLSDGGTPVVVPQPLLLPSLLKLWRTRSYRWLVLAAGTYSFCVLGQSVWFPSYLMRSYGMRLQEIGLLLGSAMIVGGTVGTILGGIIGDWLTLRDQRQSIMLIAGAGVLAMPLMAGATLTSSPGTALLFFGFGYGVVCLYVGPTFALVQTTAPLRLRAFAMAFVLLTTAILGMGFGPAAIGELSDTLASRDGGEALRHAMTWSTAAFAIPILLSVLASRSLVADIRRAREEV